MIERRHHCLVLRNPACQDTARQWLDESDAALTVMLNAMEVKTYLATLAAAVQLQ